MTKTGQSGRHCRGMFSLIDVLDRKTSRRAGVLQLLHVSPSVTDTGMAMCISVDAKAARGGRFLSLMIA